MQSAKNAKSLLKNIKECRKSVGDITDFKFNKKRCKLLNEECLEVKENSNGILYWMQRDCRVQDNWAMVFAQRMAYKSQLPLHVFFFIKPIKEYYPTMRQYKFLLEGLKHVSKELKALEINFYLLNESPQKLPLLIEKLNIGALVCDFNPLRSHRKYVNEIKSTLVDVPFVEVDAHNVVPCWLASDKQEIAARTIRSKINKKLDEFLVEFPEIVKDEFPGKRLKVEDSSFDEVCKLNIEFFKDCPNMPEIEWAQPGHEHGIETLSTFIEHRLKSYDSSRNDPSLEFQSDLSPWLHFGQIGAQRCALQVNSVGKDKNCASFLEELIVRKELADNYCYYNQNYDNFKGCDKWAQTTLDIHRKDKRPWLYTLEQFSTAKTHDRIWNAAQMQLLNFGKLHGYMRMYWCKKILEWTTSPDEAITYGLYLNDMFSLDGSDPNGFVGVMWSICGVHDHGWKERNVFGKIRYMVDYSLEKKFDIVTYCNKYLKEQNDGNVKKKLKVK